MTRQYFDKIHNCKYAVGNIPEEKNPIKSSKFLIFVGDHKLSF
jgi:hypothetical protein